MSFLYDLSAETSPKRMKRRRIPDHITTSQEKNLKRSSLAKEASKIPTPIPITSRVATRLPVR
jgi:hypothetical protein